MKAGHSLDRRRADLCADGVGGCVSAVDSDGRTIWIADAHRDNGKRFVVHADEKLTAFLELESAIEGVGP
jgi:hypothetical protein